MNSQAKFRDPLTAARIAAKDRWGWGRVFLKVSPRSLLENSPALMMASPNPHQNVPQ